MNARQEMNTILHFLEGEAGRSVRNYEADDMEDIEEAGTPYFEVWHQASANLAAWYKTEAEARAYVKRCPNPSDMRILKGKVGEKRTRLP